MSGGALETNGNRGLGDSVNLRTATVTNPISVTASSAITYRTAAGAGYGANDVTIDFAFTSDSISGTAGTTLTLLNEGTSAPATPTSHPVVFRPTFTGQFSYAGNVTITNNPAFSDRTTVLRSSNAAGTQTWSGSISGNGSFLHDGAGTAVLSGTDSYTGGTTVTAGTLETTSANVLADSGNVMLSTGAQMFLNFSGTDTINQLFFNGFATSLTGTWGSTASGATHTDDTFFSGMGKLLVSNPGGSGSSLTAASVPEPGALSLMVLVLGSGLITRTGRFRRVKR